MLAPVPSVYQSTSDSIAVGNTLVPSIPIESDAWRLQSPPSPAESTTATTFHRTRSIPKARPSTISRPSSYHHHLHRRSSHHHNRPSKQFVATTSSSIFGDWDIELKIDHRTLAKSNNAPSAVGRVAPAAAGRVGGGVGGSGSIVTIGTGPGVHTGSSGTQPLSTFPTSSSTTAPAVGGELSPALKMLKGELPQTPNSTTKTLKNNTTTTTPTKATITTPTSTKATIPKNNNTQPPWKTGQPKKNTNIDAMAAPTATVSAAAAAAAKKSWSKPDADETVNNEAASGLNALPAPTARSSFLKALGKFKTKHLQQKRSSAPPASLLPVIEPSLVEDRRASYLIPPMQFDQPETQSPSSAPLGSTPGSTKDATVTGSSVAVEPSSQQVSFADEHITDGASSLRIKLKNKVNSTLASMKSPSNLRERDRVQQTESSASELSSSAAVTPAVTITAAQGSTKNSERRQSAFVASSIDQQSDSHTINSSSSGKNRHSKNFWTFPRVRHESSQQSSSKPQVPWGVDTTAAASSSKPEESDTAMRSPELGPTDASTFAAAAAAVEDGPSTLHQQLQGLHVDEEEEQPFDSDHSLDIIQPIDYEDYTQFAELPLKKRKKMERSLAAASAARDESGGKKPVSVRASADAMKRFLTKQQQQDSKEQDKDTIEAQQSQDIGGGAINSNKKRPQVSTESTESTESSSKRTGHHQAAEWRRSFLKSLHLGKGQQGSRKVANTADPGRAQSPAPLGAIAENPQEQQSSSQKATPDSTRHARSGSVNSTRSQSLTRSTHPALLASTISKPRAPGLRRETLEMAMRRRRQSSVARSNISDTEIPPPLPFSSEFFGMENASTTNITHTFTSFTLELAEMYAQDVVNNSAVPGLFNFKERRPPRLTVSSHVMDMDTDQDFKGFDSDGDAISGYTGDADVSMDEIHVGSMTPRSPKTPTTPSMTAATTTVPQSPKTREFGMKAVVARRKVSSVDGDSDTISELPTLMIRTRDLNNRGSSGGYSRPARPLSGSSFEMDHDQFTNNREGPRSPRRTQGSALSPALSRKASRGMLISPTSPSAGSRADPSSPSRSTRAPLSMEEVVSWKPRNVNSQFSRPHVPALDTKPLKPSRGSGMLSSTTLVPSSRTPHSPTMTQSPGLISPGAGGNDRGLLNRHHYQSSSSSSSNYPHHQHQTSGDTLVSQHHLRYISSGSTMSAGSGYSAQTLTGGHYHSQYPSESAPGAREFNPNDEFSPSTPADLKAMDFEALLVTAEREHQKGWEDLMAQKKGSDNVSSRTSTSTSSPTMTSFPIPPKSSLSSSTFQRPNIPPLKITSSSSKSNTRSGHLAPHQYQRNTVAFDLGPSDDGTGTGTGSDRSMRSKRVMKKKMSVIRLTGNGNGNVQGRREDDGVIRVSVSPTPYAFSSSPLPSDGRW